MRELIEKCFEILKIKPRESTTSEENNNYKLKLCAFSDFFQDSKLRMLKFSYFNEVNYNMYICVLTNEKDFAYRGWFNRYDKNASEFKTIHEAINYFIQKDEFFLDPNRVKIYIEKSSDFNVMFNKDNYLIWLTLFDSLRLDLI